MPKIEVDEADLANDRQLRLRVQALLKHPDAAKLLEKANKLIDPNAPTPRLDAEKLQEDAVKGVSEQLTALQKQIADEKSDRENKAKIDSITVNVNAGFAKLRRERWTDDGIAAVQKLMDEKGILDPEIAAAYYEKQHPPELPSTPGGSGAWNFMELPTDTSDDIKKLIESKGENVPLVDKMVRDALIDVRGQQARR